MKLELVRILQVGREFLPDLSVVRSADFWPEAKPQVQIDRRRPDG